MSGIILPHRGIWPKISESAFIAENAVLIGDLEVGEGSSIWYGCVVRADVNRIRIGRNTNIQDGTIIHCDHDPEGDYRETGGGVPTIIGDNITVGHMALLHACTLEDDCFIGMRATVMDEVVVETGAMVAAGALVTPGKRVPGGELWAGSPAKRFRDVTQAQQDYFGYSARHYAQLADSYRRAQSDSGT
ncbi:MAG: gamma carbonic anhydrase family protein [Rhodovibrionaceae bacterium]|nr:gamma carbonic anhydrase family protein [Rhodovibrionaceae bacterium]